MYLAAFASQNLKTVYSVGNLASFGHLWLNKRNDEKSNPVELNLPFRFAQTSDSYRSVIHAALKGKSD